MGFWGLFIAGVAGGVAGHKLHIPAGGMVGAIIAIIANKMCHAEQTLAVLPLVSTFSLGG